MVTPPITATMSLLNKLQLLRRMAVDAGRDWEANLIAQVIDETPLVEINNRTDSDFLFHEPQNACLEGRVLTKVAITYRNWRFEMVSAGITTVTHVETNYPASPA